jgi:hypothetical protein
VLEWPQILRAHELRPGEVDLRVAIRDVEVHLIAWTNSPANGQLKDRALSRHRRAGRCAGIDCNACVSHKSSDRQLTAHHRGPRSIEPWWRSGTSRQPSMFETRRAACRRRRSSSRSASPIALFDRSTSSRWCRTD